MTAKFSDLIGRVIQCISIIHHGDSDKIVFTMNDGVKYSMRHDQECCEDVHIEDVVGNFKDIIKTQILKAEERINEGGGDSETYTWTFYHIATIHGCVDIRWYGSSNGYYSEKVLFERVW